MATTELAVVGTGPAGLAAAITAARVGVRVTLVDEYPRPGGQYLKGAKPAGESPPVSATERQARAMLDDLAKLLDGSKDDVGTIKLMRQVQRYLLHRKIDDAGVSCLRRNFSWFVHFRIDLFRTVSLEYEYAKRLFLPMIPDTLSRFRYFPDCYAPS